MASACTSRPRTRIPAPRGGRPAGSPAAVVAALYAGGAEQAPCDASHSHEAVRQLAFADPMGAPDPGSEALRERHRVTCEAAFTEHVGHAVEDSAFVPIIAVPPPDAWAGGTRAAPCLLGGADGGFLRGSAREAVAEPRTPSPAFAPGICRTIPSPPIAWARHGSGPPAHGDALMPEPTRIDLRGMPMDPRHQLLFGTLFGLAPGETLEVTNDHDPSGLAARLATEHAGRFRWTWLEQGPVDWRFRVERLGDGAGAS